MNTPLKFQTIKLTIKFSFIYLQTKPRHKLIVKILSVEKMKYQVENHRVHVPWCKPFNIFSYSRCNHQLGITKIYIRQTSRSAANVTAPLVFGMVVISWNDVISCTETMLSDKLIISCNSGVVYNSWMGLRENDLFDLSSFTVTCFPPLISYCI